MVYENNNVKIDQDINITLAPQKVLDLNLYFLENGVIPWTKFQRITQKYNLDIMKRLTILDKEKKDIDTDVKIYIALSVCGVRTEETLNRFNALTVEEKVDILEHEKQYKHLYAFMKGAEITYQSIVSAYNDFNF